MRTLRINLLKFSGQLVGGKIVSWLEVVPREAVFEPSEIVKCWESWAKMSTRASRCCQIARGSPRSGCSKIPNQSPRWALRKWWVSHDLQSNGIEEIKENHLICSKSWRWKHVASSSHVLKSLVLVSHMSAIYLRPSLASSRALSMSKWKLKPKNSVDHHKLVEKTSSAFEGGGRIQCVWWSAAKQ